MKYLVLLCFLVSCNQKTKLLSDSNSLITKCEKTCKEDYGENARCDFVGEITGTYYCRD